MKKVALKVLKFLGFFALGAFIFWLIYKDQDIDRIKSVLKNDVNYFWVVLSLLLGLISHTSRTMRWQLMIEPVSHKPGFVNTFLAVMIGYLMNLAFPRMGEVSRCGVLSRYEKISFTKLFGTVVAERLIDVISLLILLIIVIFSQFREMITFLNHNPSIKSKLISITTSPYSFIALAVLIILIIVFRSKIKQNVVFKKVKGILANFKEGFISIRSIKRKGWFYFHSVFIWLMYYMMLYIVFFAFDFTKGLGPIAGLTTFVLASFGMVAPVQGGIGPWHFMATEALKLYNVSYENGVIFALVAHTTTTAMIILVGLISVMILPFINRENKVATETEIQ